MKVLLADDDAVTLALHGSWLRRWGYEVVVAHDGAEALSMLAADPGLQLVVIDWMMPILDGIEVCRRVRDGRQEPYVYIVLVTSRDKKDDVVEGLDAGADDYLTKPCHAHELKSRLRAGGRIVQLQTDLVAARERLRVEARHDTLTRALNRGAVVARLEEEVARSDREKSPVAVAMLDLDHFKEINDDHGHGAGDAVLVGAACRIRAALRPYDSFGRVGGEEFLVVMPGCAGPDARGVADRLRRLLSDEPFDTPAGSLWVTASFGVAVSTGQGYSPSSAQDLLRAADAALYRAKRAGRNRTAEADDPTDPSLRYSV